MKGLLKAAVEKALPHNMKRWLNKFDCWDCIELMNKMPLNSVNLIVASPPYNLRNSTENEMKNGSSGKWGNAKLLKGYDNHEDTMPHNEYAQWQRDCLTAMVRVLSEDGVVFYNHKWRV